jgi:oligopeptide/dipeptide ABC transporter ATP-binding protein
MGYHRYQAERRFMTIATPEMIAVSLDGVNVHVETEIGRVQILHDVNIDVPAGSVVALAGESGSGKSTAMLAALKLLPGGVSVDGNVRVHDSDVLVLSPKDLRAFRATQARVIFQDPWSSLHPMHSLGAQLIESARTSDPTITKQKARERALAMLKRVGIPDPAARMKSYPHQISGGQLQRIAIAMALVASPKVLFCDEPTTALDVTTQQQILDLLQDLRESMGLTIIIATHDLDVIRGFADHLTIMYGGTVVESGSVADVLENPRHPYTWALLQADPKRSVGSRLSPLEGRPPSPDERPPGCSFAPRCSSAAEVCQRVEPVLRAVNGGGKSACTRLQIQEGILTVDGEPAPGILVKGATQ